LGISPAPAWTYSACARNSRANPCLASLRNRECHPTHRGLQE
jgi:hypothetical protein